MLRPGRRPRGLAAVARVHQRRADLSPETRGRQGCHSAGGSAPAVRPDAGGLGLGPCPGPSRFLLGPASLGVLGSAPGSRGLRPGCLCPDSPLRIASDLILAWLRL